MVSKYSIGRFIWSPKAGDGVPGSTLGASQHPAANFKWHLWPDVAIAPLFGGFWVPLSARAARPLAGGGGPERGVDGPHRCRPKWVAEFQSDWGCIYGARPPPRSSSRSCPAPACPFSVPVSCDFGFVGSFKRFLAVTVSTRPGQSPSCLQKFTSGQFR